MTLSAEAETILHEVGWRRERRVAIAPWTDVLVREGFVFSPAAERILENVGGLKVKPPGQCVFHFDPVHAASGEFDRFEEWEEIVGRRLAPLGSVWEWFLLADDEGQLYIGSYGDVELLGTLDQALSYLCVGEPKPRSLRNP